MGRNGVVVIQATHVHMCTTVKSRIKIDEIF
jgi:hypothetical protein